jgi:tetratricopeptide (TPR) repeat protein
MMSLRFVRDPNPSELKPRRTLPPGIALRAFGAAALLLALLPGCTRPSLPAGIGTGGGLDAMRRQFVALRYVTEASQLVGLHPLDRPRVQFCLGRALALRPDDKLILAKAVTLYMGVADYTAALPQVERLSKLTGDKMLLELGQCLVMTGDKQRGSEVLREAVQQAEALLRWSRGANLVSYALTLNNAGYTLADADVDLPQAQRMIEHAVEAAPLEASFTDSLGWVLYRQGDLQQAAFYLERAARQMGSHVDPAYYYHLGAVYAAQGRHDWAERALGKALEIDPHNQEAQDALRRLRYHLPPPNRV